MLIVTEHLIPLWYHGICLYSTSFVCWVHDVCRVIATLWNAPFVIEDHWHRIICSQSIRLCSCHVTSYIPCSTLRTMYKYMYPELAYVVPPPLFLFQIAFSILPLYYPPNNRTRLINLGHVIVGALPNTLIPLTDTHFISPNMVLSLPRGSILMRLLTITDRYF